ncbi:hypothetical protein [Streptomyces sp. NPDC048248]|uniref:hypothetical protein n=1 Tax=Streptomyces sp. NPDC048248 TaxID=3365523 RepID=UPI00372065FC
MAACSPHDTTDDKKEKPSASDGKGGALRLADAVGRLKTAVQVRTGYERIKLLWVDADHMPVTPAEVLISDAVKRPREGKTCKLTGGSWRSYYDDKTVTRCAQARRRPRRAPLRGPGLGCLEMERRAA